ncbi:MAG: cytochrome c, partial [Candidatus Eisenbacteria bacterium]
TEPMPRIPLPPLKPLPGWVWPALAVMTALSFLPIALIARERATRIDRPRIQIIPDMDQQPKFKAQQANPLFADGRAMRPEVPGTVARGDLRDDDAFHRGKENGGWVRKIPVPVTDRLMNRGRERYDIFCAPCHGLGGDGDGIVSARADALQEGTWIPPVSYHSDQIRERPAGHIFNTITNGIRSMPAYGPQIPADDRWAIVAYVRALQRSRNASIDDVPPDMRGRLR